MSCFSCRVEEFLGGVLQFYKVYGKKYDFETWLFPVGFLTMWFFMFQSWYLRNHEYYPLTKCSKMSCGTRFTNLGEFLGSYELLICLGYRGWQICIGVNIWSKSTGVVWFWTKKGDIYLLPSSIYRSIMLYISLNQVTLQHVFLHKCLLFV